MASKIETAVRPDALQVFLDRLRTSDGELLGIDRSHTLLVTKFRLTTAPDDFGYCLTLLKRLKDDPGKLIPYGWTGLRINKKGGETHAFGSKFSIFFLTPGDNRLQCSNFTSADDTTKLFLDRYPGMYIPIKPYENLLFSAGTGIRVAKRYRNKGWGSFLIQARAHIAIHAGADRLIIKSEDLTPQRGNTKISLFEKALGERKVFIIPQMDWYIPIGPNTPVDTIAAKLI